MPITEAYGTSATIGSTEWSLPNNSGTLTPITDDGVYQLFLDVSAVTSADSFTLKAKEKVQSSGTQRVFFTQTFGPISVSDPNFVSPPFLLLHGWDWTLTKDAGTDRSISWSIRKTAGAVVSEYTANSASISTTEYSLPNNSTTPANVTDDGLFQLWLDMNALVAGDEFEMKEKEKVLSGGTQRVYNVVSSLHAQAEPIYVAPACVLLHGWDKTLKRIAGSDRTIGWSVRRAA